MKESQQRNHGNIEMRGKQPGKSFSSSQRKEHALMRVMGDGMSYTATKYDGPTPLCCFLTSAFFGTFASTLSN